MQRSLKLSAAVVAMAALVLLPGPRGLVELTGEASASISAAPYGSLDAASAGIIGGWAYDPDSSSAVKVAPGELPAVRKVDPRFQSYNVETVEVIGGRFWAPYKKPGQAAAKPDGEKSGGVDIVGAMFQKREPLDLKGDHRLRVLAKALGPAYVRVSGAWANSTFAAGDFVSASIAISAGVKHAPRISAESFAIISSRTFGCVSFRASPRAAFTKPGSDSSKRFFSRSGSSRCARHHASSFSKAAWRCGSPPSGR